MNVKEYISSGIVESYVLGLVSDTERQEFEKLCTQYQEIVLARKAFEKSLEEKLLKDATVPPPHVKELVTERLKNFTAGMKVSGEPFTVVRNLNYLKWIAAASIILLVVSAIWAIGIYNRNRDLVATNNDLQNQLQQSNIHLNEIRQQMNVLQEPGMKMAALKGTAHAPGAMATVYWDTAKTKNVYLLINNMPMPSSDKQYQLWALLNGKPVNLGIFDMNTRQQRLLVKMQNVQKAEAFAITLERKGGSDKPTMDSMYVMGSL
ncbi:MAG: anti-sigma factor domain-containing protein [Flavisolibacter sp.]